jgi:hypothetical protein
MSTGSITKSSYQNVLKDKSYLRAQLFAEIIANFTYGQLTEVVAFLDQSHTYWTPKWRWIENWQALLAENPNYPIRQILCLVKKVPVDILPLLIQQNLMEQYNRFLDHKIIPIEDAIICLWSKTKSRSWAVKLLAAYVKKHEIEFQCYNPQNWLRDTASSFVGFCIYGITENWLKLAEYFVGFMNKTGQTLILCLAIEYERMEFVRHMLNLKFFESANRIQLHYVKAYHKVAGAYHKVADAYTLAECAQNCSNPEIASAVLAAIDGDKCTFANPPQKEKQHKSSALQCKPPSFPKNTRKQYLQVAKPEPSIISTHDARFEADCELANIIASESYRELTDRATVGKPIVPVSFNGGMVFIAACDRNNVGAVKFYVEHRETKFYIGKGLVAKMPKFEIPKFGFGNCCC